MTAGTSLLKQLFHADTSVKDDESSTIGYEQIISLTCVQKMDEIINTVSKLDSYYTDLRIATDDKNIENNIVFVNIVDTFFSRLNFNSYNILQQIKESNYLEFEKGDMPISQDSKILYNVPYDPYNYKDEYYRDCRYRFVLTMSVDKMETSPSFFSHLGTSLRISNGRIRLGVFGQLRNVNDLYFQIKPFAVWW